ncbi:MAG: hypothetical protein O3B13_21615, partial [Planctomycetota bacterium]|nr:hypothetical protein [Planctomycetota bacterium]
STQAMTETLFTFLVALLLVIALRTGHIDRENQNSVLLGTVFGLTALCRPTIWAFGGLAALGWGFQQIQHRLKNRRSLEPDRLTPFFRAGLCVVATVLVVLPWVLRNARQFNHPIVMTTHGGYTLLLGNNETFFQQVVAGKSGATWTEASLETWKAENKRKLASMGIAPSDEVSEDAAQVKLAKTWIIANPTKFLRACRLRIRRFWACRPSVAPGVPPVLVQLVGYYYSSVFVLAIVGALRWWKLWLKYWPLPAFVLALTIVHSVYWSNARMRSAAVPVITLAAAAAFQRTFHSAGADQAFLQE